MITHTGRIGIIALRVYPITFSNDKCGSVEEYATELNNIVNRILQNTGSQKVNIVAHSKGGLDAR